MQNIQPLPVLLPYQNSSKRSIFPRVRPVDSKLCYSLMAMDGFGVMSEGRRVPVGVRKTRRRRKMERSFGFHLSGRNMSGRREGRLSVPARGGAFRYGSEGAALRGAGDDFFIGRGGMMHLRPAGLLFFTDTAPPLLEREFRGVGHRHWAAEDATADCESGGRKLGVRGVV